MTALMVGTRQGRDLSKWPARTCTLCRELMTKPGEALLHPVLGYVHRKPCSAMPIWGRTLPRRVS